MSLQFDDFMDAPPRRKIPDLNIVPIIDMLVTVIFFLLLSTTFIEYVKQTLPATSSVAAPAGSKNIPKSPRLIARSEGGSKIVLALSWEGPDRGSLTSKTLERDREGKNLPLGEEAQRLATEFKQKFPEENVLRVGLASDLNVQELVTVLDGTKKVFQDISLISLSGANP